MNFRSICVFTALVLGWLSTGVPVQGQSPTEPALPVLAAGPYQVGEHLTYSVAFASFATAAHAEIWIAGRGQYLNRDGMELRARVETTDVVNAALYAINNDYTTYIDPATGQPYYTKVSIHEGGRNSEFANEYNAPTGTGAIPPTVSKGEFLGVYDLLSAAYRIRAVSFSDGADYNFTVRGENSEYAIEAKPVGRQLVKSSIGSFMALVIQLGFPQNSELNKYRAKIYVSDDDRRVPLLLTARLKSGELRVEIASSEVVPTAKPRNGPGSPPVAFNPRTTGVPPTSPVNGIPGIPSNVTPVTPGGNIPGIPGISVKGDPTGAANPSGSLAVKPFPSELPFKGDEVLNFTVFLQGITQPVGLVSFHVNGRNFYFGKDSLMVSAKAETANAAQHLFLANEQITSYLDPVSLLPNRTDLLFQGTRNAKSDTLQMDQDRGQATTKKGQVEIPVGTHDLLSLVYAIRSFNLAPGRTSVLPLLINGKVYQLTINSLQRETIQLGSQKITAFQLSILTNATEPDRYQLRLWVSDDSRRLPLRFAAKTPLGVVSADLAIAATK
jgi:hypothetical protein